MTHEAANRLRERWIMLLAWSGTVIVVMWLGAGFAGGIEGAFEHNPVAWLATVSPLIPLVLWLRARAAFRASSRRGGDSHE